MSPKPARRSNPLEDPEIRQWPDLSFHYGLGFTELADMPRWAVRLYAERLPELLAERQLAAAQAAAYPNMKPSAQRSYFRQLQRASGARRQAAHRPKNVAAAAAGVGIGMKVVSASTGEEVEPPDA